MTICKRESTLRQFWILRSNLTSELRTLPFAAALEPERYDIVFLDPPYGSRMLDRVIESWVTNRFSRVLVAEYATGHALPPVGDKFVFDKRIFEDTAVTIYRREPEIVVSVVSEPQAHETD